MSAVEVRPLDGVGAEVHGIDVGSASDDDIETILSALGEHGVVFFRGQDIDERQHIAFAARFAPINVNRFFAAHPQFPEIALVAKDVDQKDNIGGGWHTDHSYDDQPALGSILVARELPDEGGDTLFASMYAAYEALPEPMKAKLSSMDAVHSAKHIFGQAEDTYYNQTDAGGGRIGNATVADRLADVVHPVVVTHPISGRKALYVNPAFTVRFDGMTAEESKPLLDELYAHAVTPSFVHRFKWEPGSIAFWDNRATWHYALNDYHGRRRVMHRITLEGCALH